MAYVFLSFTSFLYVLIKKQELHICVAAEKDMKAQREDHVATRLPRL